MDPNIVQLVKQLKEGHISQENLVDALSSHNSSMCTPIQNKEQNPIFSSSTAPFQKQLFMTENKPLTSHNQIIFSTYNDKYSKYGIQPLVDISSYLNGQLNSYNKEIESTPLEYSNQHLDTSAVIPDEVKPYLLEDGSYNFSALESERKRPALSRPTVKRSNDFSIHQDEKMVVNMETKRGYENGDQSVVLGMNNEAMTSIHGDRSPYRQSCGDCNEIFSSLPVNYQMPRKDDFMERNLRWQERKNLKIQEQQSRKQQEEIKACTFQPEINKSSRSLSMAFVPCHKRLNMNLRSSTAERVRKVIKDKEEQEFKKECTFRPNITPVPVYLKTIEKNQPETPNQTATFLGQQYANTNPGNTEMNGFIPSLIETKTDKYITSEEKECKFVPQVNHIGNAMGNVRKYLEQNVVDRLYKKSDDIFNEIKKHKFVVENADAFTENVRKENWKAANDPRLYTSEGSHDPQQVIDLAKLSFFERQEYYKQKKEYDLMNIEESVRPSFTPSITAAAANINFKVGIYDRGRSYLEMVEQKKQFIQANQESECKFAPQITQKAHNIPTRTVDQMIYDPLKKRLSEAAAYKINQENLFKSQYTFTPQVYRDKSKEKIESRLGIDKSHKDYIDTYNQKLMMKNNLKMIIDANKAKKELEGCTFKPETTGIPAYLAKNNL